MCTRYTTCRYIGRILGITTASSLFTIFAKSGMASNLDKSYIGPYLQDWLKYIRESIENEIQTIAEGNELYIPYAGAQPDMIRMIFVASRGFSVEPRSRYLSVHLLDRYMGKLFWELLTETGSSISLSDQAEKMAGQIKLITASCLQIASKIDLYKTGLGIKQIQSLLSSIDPDREYSKSAIFACELRILKSLDFRMPVSLPYDVMELLLEEVGLGERALLRDTSLHLLDVAYLRHNELFEQLHLMARGRRLERERPDCRDFLCVEADAGFIAAAVLVCACFFVQLRRSVAESLAARLARLVHISPIDLSILANVLFTLSIDERDFEAIREDLGDRAYDES